MSPNLITIAGTIVGVLLSGQLLKAILDFVRDSRRDKGEREDQTFKTLRELNADLRAQVVELKGELTEARKALDDERHARMRLEDRVAELERIDR